MHRYAYFILQELMPTFNLIANRVTLRFPRCDCFNIASNETILTIFLQHPREPVHNCVGCLGIVSNNKTWSEVIARSLEENQ